MYHQEWYQGEEEIAVKCPEPGNGSLHHFGVCRKQLAGKVFVRGLKVMKITGSRTTNRNSHWLRPYGCKFTAHLPSSPNVSLTQFHFLVHLKKTAVGTRFVTDATLKRAVTSSTDADADFFRCGIQALAPRWDDCLIANGDYVGVWCVPSATRVPRAFWSQKKVLGGEVFVKLSLELPCICVVEDADSEDGSFEGCEVADLPMWLTNCALKIEPKIPLTLRYIYTSQHGVNSHNTSSYALFQTGHQLDEQNPRKNNFFSRGMK